MKMEIKQAKQIIITWSSSKYGVCEAVFWNGELTNFKFCREGSLTSSGISTNDINFLTELYEVLGQLLMYMTREKE